MVEVKRTQNLSVSVTAVNHRLTSDVSAKNGGDDAGPNPHQILEASLGACTSITVQMYANRKGWPLKSANVTVRIEAEGREGSKITRDISFEGELSPEQRERLFEIANKCPIHILLESQVAVVSQLVS